MKIRLYWDKHINMWSVRTSKGVIHAKYVLVNIPMVGITQERSPKASLIGDGVPLVLAHTKTKKVVLAPVPP